MKCGLLGEKLGHSYSPEIHKHFGTYSYSLFEKSPEALQSFLQSDLFDGLNVTIPYKKAVIPFCSRLTEQAKKLGAVNTIIRNGDGTLTGHNTDYFGFQSMMNHSGLDAHNKKVLVLGSGGASNTVCAVLQELGANVVVISRSGENNYENLRLHQDCSIIVNTTPVGMYPKTGVSPIDLSLFDHLEGVLDVIYNPSRTQLLLDAEKRNIKTENGLWMLVAQAKESAEWFSGNIIPDQKIETIYRLLKAKMENIVLIGMPGCGKSTIGKILAEKLHKEFVDADLCIEQSANLTIPEIFKTSGEDGFRKMESQVLRELGKKSGQIIATGGGCVTRQENYSHLHQNGTIIWIKRALDTLPTDGRPLSQTNSLEKMYEERRPMYQAFSDFVVDNQHSAEETANAIIQILQWEAIL